MRTDQFKLELSEEADLDLDSSYNYYALENPIRNLLFGEGNNNTGGCNFSHKQEP
jgi:hypothetical protein